jgi:Kef-type K+ transport system membrane component KefB
LLFLVQTLIIVMLPVAVVRLPGLKGLLPLVVTQIVVGIALGPSLFGRVCPEIYHIVFNEAALSPLSGISMIAVLFFGFISGLHLDPGIFRGKGRAFVAVALASILVPTVLGCVVGLWIALRYPGELVGNASPAAFAAAVGICTGVTALPVLGAILHEMKLLGNRIGHFALAIAGINDAALWILLGLLLTAVAGPNLEGPGPLIRVCVLPVYLTLMVWIVRPVLERTMVARINEGKIYEGGLAIVCAVAISSALVTESIGLHYILGAFVAGALMPDALRPAILDRLQAATLALLMPFFFMLTGLRTFIDFSSSAFIEIVILATMVAVIGKFGGIALVTRLVGEPWPIALGLGALLQTKGLMEVIVLAILRDAGIITENVFSSLIVMAVVSTALAMPLTRLILAQGRKPKGNRLLFPFIHPEPSEKHISKAARSRSIRTAAP